MAVPPSCATQAAVVWQQPFSYSDHQVANFWNETDVGTRRAVVARAESTVALNPRLERIRKRLLAASRPSYPVIRRKNASPLGASALSIQSFDALDVLMHEWILKAESQAETHHCDQRPAARAGRAASEFFLGLRDYCRVYSSVVQLMAGVSQGYSTAALEILTLFMTVAVNKREIERDLDATIQTLKCEYERIGLLKGIYSTERIKVCVADLYRLGVEFLQEATIYYSSTSRKRIWHAFIRPPDIDLKAKISIIEGVISELVQERDTLNRIRLARVEDKVDSQLSHTSNELIVSRLEMIKSTLGLPRVSPPDELRRFTSLLGGAFARLKRIPPFDPQDLFFKAPFIAWEEVATWPSSSFLLLHGRTVAPHNTPLSWTSQTTVAVVQHLQAENVMVAWHLCKPDDEYDNLVVSGDPTFTAAFALLSLGYRLLELTPIGRAALGNLTSESATHFKALRDYARAAQEILAGYESAGRNASLMDCSRAAMAFLRASITMVTQRNRVALPGSEKLAVIYLVVDRFDVLPLRDTAFLRPLMELVQKPPVGAVVKVFVAGEKKMRDQKGGDGVAEFVEDCEGKTGWGVVDMDQGQK